jgi:hypothetical protein
MTTTEQDESRATGALRTTVGVVLFSVWAVLALLWVYDALHALVDGVYGPAIKSVCTLLLLAVLAGMEGFEVVYIKLWQKIYPERTEHDLAAWLAARQLFVALIVVANTLLGDRQSIAVPFTSKPITNSVELKAFNLFFTTLLVLWFAQILPKHMAAVNADRYLKLFRPVLSPVVEFVRRIGISLPAEITAKVVQYRLGWHAETLERAPRPGEDLADAWAALIPERPPEQ